MAERKLNFKVLPNEAGMRLDAFLVKHHSARSRSQWAIAIRNSQVLIDGREAKASHLLKRGQVATVITSAKSPKVVSKIKLPIIYQDKDLLVVNKPANLVMHPAGRHKAGTLLDILESQFPEVYLVHRLDKDTSGVVLVARNLKAKEYLSSAFAKHLVKKTYLALLVGKITPQQAYLDMPIKRDRSGKFGVAKQGRSAKSFYKVLEYLPRFSLVEVNPESGRTHQIRVHFNAIKHPVVGDEMYGQAINGLSRQFLHAAKIEFVDTLGKLRQFTAPLPEDLNNFLNESR